MIRTTVLAAAAALIAAPALAASAPPAEHVSIAGKTPQEAHAAITKAASKVCLASTRNEPMFVYLYSSCVQDAVSRAVAQTGDARIAAAGKPVMTAGR